MHHLLYEIGISVIAATVFGLTCHLFRQPIILGYLLAGVLVGPELGLSLVTDTESVEIISELGLILLLYIIGLEINLKDLLSSGKQLLVTGFGQFPICFLLGLVFFNLVLSSFVNTQLEGVYLALLCALSSTAIVVKALYDKGELDTLPGKLTLGTLVIQDIYAILLLALQPNLADPKLLPVAIAIGNTLLLIIVGLLVSKFVLRRIFHAVAKTPEMVVCVSIAWCAAAAGAGDMLGLSREMGALVAGLSISAFPYSVHVTAKTLPLRDFFLTLFFVSLGMKITMPTYELLAPVLIVSCFIFASRFLSVYILASAVGAGRRAAFITSLNLAQVGEFALVIGSLAIVHGHVGEQLVSILIFSMVLLSVISSYAIRFNHQLFLAYDKLLGRFLPEAATKKHAISEKDGNYEIVFLGFHRGARALLETLIKRHPELVERVLVVDFNPLTLEELQEQGVAVMFGDIASFDTLQHAPIGHARVMLSTIPDMLLKGIDNRSLVQMAKSIAPQTWMVATGDDQGHERILRAEGADLVVRPFDLMGEWLASFVHRTVNAEDSVAEAITEIEGGEGDLLPESAVGES